MFSNLLLCYLSIKTGDLNLKCQLDQVDVHIRREVAEKSEKSCQTDKDFPKRAPDSPYNHPSFTCQVNF